MADYTARKITDWFLLWADAQEDEDAGLTHLKIQKLLYYAQGHFLAERGKPLFDNPMEAWGHGPVVPDEYHRLKSHVGRTIDVDVAVSDEFDWNDYRDIEKHLMKVWNTYGQYTAWALRQKTHNEAPWLEASKTGYNAEIDNDTLREFFSRE